MITHDTYYQGRDVHYKSEFTPLIAHNGDHTIATVNRLLLRCYDDTGLMFDQCNSGWRPSAVNAVTANSGLLSSHITAEAADEGDGPSVFRIEDAPRILARWTIANELVLEELGLWCEDPRWTARFNETVRKWFFWVHYQTKPPRSGKRFYIPNSSPPVTPPLDPWVHDQLTFKGI